MVMSLFQFFLLAVLLVRLPLQDLKVFYIGFKAFLKYVVRIPFFYASVFSRDFYESLDGNVLKSKKYLVKNQSHKERILLKVEDF